MRSVNIKNPLTLTVLLYSLSSIMLYLGVFELIELVTNILKGLEIVFNFSSNITLYGSLILPFFIVVILLILILKVANAKYNELPDYIHKLWSNKKPLFTIAYILIFAYILNLIAKLTILDVYEDLLSTNLKNKSINELISYEHFSTIATTLIVMRKILIILLFIITLKKVSKIKQL